MKTVEHLLRAPHRSGFTVVELLSVIVIIGALATIAIPRFYGTKDRAYVVAMTSDLRNLITAEEAYAASNNTYTADKSAAGLNFAESAGVTVMIAVTPGTPGSYRAMAVHTATDITCAVFVNQAAQAPATSEGEPGCG